VRCSDVFHEQLICPISPGISVYPLYRKTCLILWFLFCFVFPLHKVCVYILCNAVNLIAYGHALLCMAVSMHGESLLHFASRSIMSLLTCYECDVFWWCIADPHMCNQHVQDFFTYSSLDRAAHS